MKIIIALLMISISVFAEDQQIRGEYRLNLKVGSGKITALQSTDRDVKYSQYELIFSREIIVNDSFGVEFGLGGGAYLIKDEMPDDQEMPYEIRTGLVLINPKFFFNRNLSLGIFITPFVPNPIRLSSTEMAVVNKGLNFEIRNCIINRINCGFYYSNTEATTKRTLETFGVSIGFDL